MRSTPSRIIRAASNELAARLEREHNKKLKLEEGEQCKKFI
jgi:hypothetical protein